MFIVYHSNSLEVQKDILVDRLNGEMPDNPLQAEVILVQSPGMAQWLQLQIAEKQGVAANLRFPLPASFIWQQYADNLPNVAQQNRFGKNEMTWRLMKLIKQPEFRPHFNAAVDESSDQMRDFRLARNIADLFDQYLVYRPDWIMAWERDDDSYIARQIATSEQERQALPTRIRQDIAWQGALWRALTEEIRTIDGSVQHRAHLHRRYLQKLEREKPVNLPARLFIFGISALPGVYLETFKAIGNFCDVHLFFNNPSRYYWGDIVDPVYLQKLQISHRTLYRNGTLRQQTSPLFSAPQLQRLADEQYELTQDNEKLQVGHPLLAAWGKAGRDFFYLLEQVETQSIDAYVEPTERNLLAQVQKRILELEPGGGRLLNRVADDRSLTIRSCHSAMREVEVLHDYLLQLFQQDSNLTPKDVVVMVGNIDRYAPYIQAVFRQYSDNRHIPFSIADGKLSAADVLLAAFLSLLALKDSRFTAEEMLALLDIPAIRRRFGIETAELELLRHWVASTGIRFGLEKYPAADSTDNNRNYNSWQAGLERLLLGYAMREENGIWQDGLGYDGSYGLKGRLAGALAEFIDSLSRWREVLRQEWRIEQWQQHLIELVEGFFAVDEQTVDTLLYIKNTVQRVTEQLQAVPFEQPLGSEVITEVMTEQLNDNDGSMKFLVGKVSFCTLMPMRSIPFKTVCLLGMNDGDYPRRQARSGFDLMQYHYRKGDRSRRDDDRYLFLEALLAAQDYLYISYVGRSIIDNSPQEPSALVTQLLDYLHDNLPPEQQHIPLVLQHSMNIFSPQNFSETHRTFAKEWLPLTAGSHMPPQDFLAASDAGRHAEVPSERERSVEFSRFIRFVQNPVRFFFEHRLGVFFRAGEELIDDTENFILEGLERYAVNQQLLVCDETETERFFAELKVKGILPRGEFGNIYRQKVRSEIQAFREVIGTYQTETPDSRFIELPLPTTQGDVLLYGNIGPLFGAERRRIVWRVGRETDRYLIENWLYYLLQTASEDAVISPPLCYAKGSKGVEGYTFKTLEKTTALKLLETYVEGYTQNAMRLLPIPTDKIADYLKLLNSEEADKDAYRAYLHRLAYGDDYNRGDIYWQRLLSQTSTLDLAEINREVRAWFVPMLEHRIKI